MPELPEVETYVRALEPLLLGKTVLKAEVRWPRTIAAPDPARFTDLVRKRRFSSFGRRGKYMLLGLDSGETLIVHLRMTGELRLLPPTPPDAGAAPAPIDKHTHVLFDLDSSEQLRYRDTRKFGRIWLVEDSATVIGNLGPEPLDENFVPKTLAQSLAERKASIKALLLNQTVLAGVGNIYADESLFRAKIDPRRPGGSLALDEIERLHLALRDVLLAGIEAQGSSVQNYAPPTGAKGGFQEQFQVFRRSGEPCFTCGTPISRTVLSQRSTHFCPVCQR